MQLHFTNDLLDWGFYMGVVMLGPVGSPTSIAIPVYLDQGEVEKYWETESELDHVLPYELFEYNIDIQRSPMTECDMMYAPEGGGFGFGCVEPWFLGPPWFVEETLPDGTVVVDINDEDLYEAWWWDEVTQTFTWRGYPGVDTLFYDSFEDGILPGWTISNTHPSDPGWTWATTLTPGSHGYPYWGDNFVFHDDVYLPEGGIGKSWLVTPPVEIPDCDYAAPEFNGCPDTVLTFAQRDFYQDRHYYEYPLPLSPDHPMEPLGHCVYIALAGEEDPEDIFYDDWTRVWCDDVDNPWLPTVIDLSSWQGDEIYIAFGYQGNYNDEWYLDDIFVFADWGDNDTDVDFLLYALEDLQGDEIENDVTVWSDTYLGWSWYQYWSSYYTGEWWNNYWYQFGQVVGNNMCVVEQLDDPLPVWWRIILPMIIGVTPSQ
jgi:hypothetical protein